MKYLFKLRAYLKPYLWQLILNMLFLLSMTGLSLVIPQIIQGVIDQGLKVGRNCFPGPFGADSSRHWCWHSRFEPGATLPDRMDRSACGLRSAQCHV